MINCPLCTRPVPVFPYNWPDGTARFLCTACLVQGFSRTIGERWEPVWSIQDLDVLVGAQVMLRPRVVEALA